MAKLTDIKYYIEKNTNDLLSTCPYKVSLEYFVRWVELEEDLHSKDDKQEDKEEIDKENKVPPKKKY